MEKFGIFELLDALSAIALEEETAKPAPENEKGDASYFAPPVYGDQTPPPAAPEKERAGEFAINEFYRKHDERSGK